MPAETEMMVSVVRDELLVAMAKGVGNLLLHHYSQDQRTELAGELAAKRHALMKLLPTDRK